MMRTRVILVRHGDSHHTADDILGGPFGDRGLTELGRAQAQALAYRLATDAENWDQVAIYSSTLPRAIETAAPIADALGVTADTDCGLCSWHIPAFADGLRHSEFRAKYGLTGGGVFRPFEQGSETWAEMVTRASRSMVELATKHRGGTLILVCHAETIEISFNAYGLLAPYRTFDVEVAPTSVTEWHTDDDPAAGLPPARWTLSRFNHRELS